MKVYVAVSYNREHQAEVVGVASTPEVATHLVKEYRKEHLKPDEHLCLNDYHGDMVGSVLPFDVVGADNCGSCGMDLRTEGHAFDCPYNYH